MTAHVSPSNRLSMKSFYISICTFFLMFLLTGSLAGYAQAVTLTATSGTASGSFTTLKGAFDAINAGTHKGDIVININSSYTS